MPNLPAAFDEGKRQSLVGERFMNESRKGRIMTPGACQGACRGPN